MNFSAGYFPGGSSWEVALCWQGHSGSQWYQCVNPEQQVLPLLFESNFASSFIVGKTSLITRFMYDSFDNTYQVCGRHSSVNTSNSHY